MIILYVEYQLKIYTDPFLHAIITPPTDIYDYAKSIYPNSEYLLDGARTNIDITDKLLNTYIDGVVDEAYNAFLPRLKEEYPKMDFTSLATRKRHLFSHNTPNSRPNVIRGLHLDSGTKVIIGLWYFKDENDSAGGDLYLVNPITKQDKIFKYASNSLIIFPNLLTSWHAVTERAPSTIARKFINIILESDTFLHSYDKQGSKEPRVKVSNNFK